MVLVNSRNINNRIKKTSIVTAVIFHIILALITFGLSLVVLAIVGIATLLLLNKEIAKGKLRDNNFNKIYPFGLFGQKFGSFQHVFHHSYSIEKDIYTAFEKELKAKTPIISVKTVPIIDTDPDLNNCEQRSFIKAELEPTSHGNAITLVLNQSKFGSMRTIQWRVLPGGYIDKNKIFNLIAYSLFSIYFWIGNYLKGEVDLLSRVRKIYPGAYNDMDIEIQVRCLHEVVFDAMIVELGKNGIDTGELKLQKLQLAKISVTDGKMNMVGILRGVMRKVSGRAKEISA